ncbi:unnamed protein product [Vicia faba]|uniref:Uncharacterized protein n=1 Tax=Vicia faba TaxID=3906 RepID=A0AAV1B368_VICFA|nr:unnamed protein product [Vicia faba]
MVVAKHRCRSPSDHSIRHTIDHTTTTPQSNPPLTDPTAPPLHPLCQIEPLSHTTTLPLLLRQPPSSKSHTTITGSAHQLLETTRSVPTSMQIATKHHAYPANLELPPTFFHRSETSSTSRC